MSHVTRHTSHVTCHLQHGRVLIIKEVHNHQPQPALVLNHVLRRLGQHLQIGVFGKENNFGLPYVLHSLLGPVFQSHLEPLRKVLVVEEAEHTHDANAFEHVCGVRRVDEG